MLIVCSGPDTWHARRRAQELVAAFRKKHDPSGLSTEIRHELDVPGLLNSLATPSLFAPKRLVRCDGLLEGLKIAEVRALAKRLKDDADQTVLLTVEDEPPSKKILDEFSDIKVVHYPSPPLSGAAFTKWCSERAKELGVPLNDAQEIARRTDGDTWLAEQELEKRAANPSAPLLSAADDPGSVFDVAERYLTDGKEWREDYDRLDDEQKISVLLAQARSAIRVRDGAISGIHPYAAKKLGALRMKNPEKKLLDILRAVAASRQSLCASTETETLI